MNISKFLLIDAAIVIATIPIFYLIQSRHKKSPLFQNSNKENLSGKTSIKLPEKRELLELEKIAKIKGSGIESDSLFGRWKFISVCKKNTDKEDPIFSSLLRTFSANLEIKKVTSIEDLPKFSITVSIKFGVISIEFAGNGYLKGEQPILPFLFNLIELKSGSSIFLSRSLEEPLEKEKLFFALIASEKEGRWLSARGQGGALILWLKD